MEERALLASVEFLITVPTMSDWIGVVCLRHEVVTPTPGSVCHTYAPEIAMAFVGSLEFQVELSERFFPATWQSALVLSSDDRTLALWTLWEVQVSVILATGPSAEMSNPANM